jgi:hypothetical protein
VISLVLTCDPDSLRSGLAWAVSHGSESSDFYDFTDVIGGGSGAVASWQSISGMSTLLCGLTTALGVDLSNVTFVCETQAPNGPQSADVETLRRVRYHWQATCEIVGTKYVEAIPSVWMQSFVGEQLKGTGAMKAAYRKRAKELTPLATNEDRAAAVGMLVWYVESIGSRLVFPAC